jgi:hypothetical protein
VVGERRNARTNAIKEMTTTMLSTTALRREHVGLAIVLIAALVAAMTALIGRPAHAEVVQGYYNVNNVRVAGNATTDVDTGISLKTGDRIVVSADGTVNPGCLFCTDTGPAGYTDVAPDDGWPLKGARQISLLGKLNGQYFYVGAGKDWVNTGGPGELYLYINDWKTDDNSGAYLADIRVDRDVPMPETAIASGPSGPTASTSATFTFSGSSPEGFVGFECNLDGNGFAPCSSPRSYTGLSQGQHTLEVRSKDRFGRVDPTPAGRSWTVDTVNPAVTSVVPRENATGVAPGTNASAFFSEDMDAASINANTVKLFKAGTTTRIGGTVSYDPTTRKATFDPFNKLKLGTKYKVVVTTGVKDAVGNPLDQNPGAFGDQPKKWLFTIRN